MFGSSFQRKKEQNFNFKIRLKYNLEIKRLLNSDNIEKMVYSTLISR